MVIQFLDKNRTEKAGWPKTKTAYKQQAVDFAKEFLG
jgi:hypothetical protein